MYIYFERIDRNRLLLKLKQTFIYRIGYQLGLKFMLIFVYASYEISIGSAIELVK